MATHCTPSARLPRALLALALVAGAPAVHARDYVASLGYLPGLTESADAGPFVDLVKAIDERYAQGHIERQLFPMLRSLDSVVSGQTDFHVPMLRNPAVDPETLPYRYASEPMGVVSFVIYSS